MSETSKEWDKFRYNWGLLNPQDKRGFIGHMIGYALMGVSIAGAFGFWGALFDVGVLLWYMGKP